MFGIFTLTKQRYYSYQSGIYTDAVKLDIDPVPDTRSRVFVAWYSSDKAVENEEHELL